MSDAVQKLTDEELKSLREVKVSLNLKGLVEGWEKLFYKVPFGIYQTIARKVEGVSKKMMTGNGAFIGFPLGIILRNTSRAAYNSSRWEKYGYVTRIAGGLTAAAIAATGVWLGGPALAGTIGLGLAGKALAYLAASTAATASLTPVFSAATLAISSAVATGAAAFSTLISAPLNAIVGWRRSKASRKGRKLTDDQIAEQEEAFDRRSPTIAYNNKLKKQINDGFSKLPQADKEIIYKSIQADFAEAQKNEAEAAAKAAAKAARKRGAAPASTN